MVASTILRFIYDTYMPTFTLARTTFLPFEEVKEYYRFYFEGEIERDKASVHNVNEAFQDTFRREMTSSAVIYGYQRKLCAK